MGIKGSKNNKLKRSIFLLLLILFLVALGTGAFFYNYIGKFSKNYNGQELKNKDIDSTVNVLVLGMDIGDPKQMNNKSVQRTDTMIVIHYEPNEKKAILVSIPRDILININKSEQKINNAYALGGDQGVKTAVESIIDTPIDYIVKVDYEGFRGLIDAIGGVEMTIDRDMYYDDNEQNLHIRFKKGETVLLDGEKAEEFFRWRKNNDGTGFPNGDLDRIENQHKFISKLIDKSTSVSILPKVGKLLNILPKYIETDMPPKNIMSYGLSFLNINNNDVKMFTIKGIPKDINKVSYLIYDNENNDDILAAINSDTSAASYFTKKNLKIKILNATRIYGLAANCAKELEKKGYKNIVTGNAYETSKSEIQLKDKQLRSIITNDIKIGKVTSISKKDEDSDIIIILGRDYKKFGEEQ
ncbi:transcriptional regulator [Clostridium polyendosporum]|uniref:Transcriptional regulator n=1 Tax=Clostridium polyendosporum TaxID=69208 RepID=A0A919VGI8_9CLOT|nr:LCP family protein [Clostridium polyendosporum]GIM29222.1 transcriptional regulator [Clostridium polyendosporum]